MRGISRGKAVVSRSKARARARGLRTRDRVAENPAGWDRGRVIGPTTKKERSTKMERPFSTGPFVLTFPRFITPPLSSSTLRYTRGILHSSIVDVVNGRCIPSKEAISKEPSRPETTETETRSRRQTFCPAERSRPIVSKIPKLRVSLSLSLSRSPALFLSPSFSNVSTLLGEEAKRKDRRR